MRLVRLCAFLLLLLLCLTGCTAILPHFDIKTRDTPTFSPAPTQNKVSETKNGVKIQVDYSAYQADSGSKNHFTRLSPDWVEDLQPSQDYGRIYPFVGGLLYGSNESGDNWIIGRKYGLIDEKGRIIVDPVYSFVEVAHYMDVETGQMVYLPYWVLKKTVKENNEEVAREYYSVAKIDGSFVTEGNALAYQCGPYGICLAQDWEMLHFMILDKEGNTILTEKDMPYPAGTYAIVGFGDGYFTVYHYDTNKTIYIDSTGKQSLLASWDYGQDFSSQRACVRKGDFTGVIDTKGNWIVAPDTYLSIDRYRNDVAIAMLRELGNIYYTVLNTKGEPILDGKYDWISLSLSGNICTYQEREGIREIYDREGKLLFSCKGKNVAPLTNLDLLVTTLDSPLDQIEYDLTSIPSGATCRLSSYPYGTGYAIEGEYSYNHFVYTRGYEKGELSVLYAPDTLKPLLSHKGDFSEVQDPFTGMFYLAARTGNAKTELYQLDLQKKGIYMGEVTPYGDVFMVVNDRCCCYLNENGEEIFSYSLICTVND